MSDCQFPDQCGFPNCFCVGDVNKNETNEAMQCSCVQSADTIRQTILWTAYTHEKRKA